LPECWRKVNKEITKETKFKLTHKMWTLLAFKGPKVFASTPYRLKEQGENFRTNFRNYISSEKLKESEWALECKHAVKAV
jgi:hypothetical protein